MNWKSIFGLGRPPAPAISVKGLRLVMESEGCRLEAYKDVGGVWTIGFGHTGPMVREGITITREEAERLLKADLAECQSAIAKLVRVKLTQGQYDALVDFIFNLGSKAFATSTLLRKLNLKDFSGAADEFARWNHVGTQVIEGLTIRRNRERDLFVS